MADGEVWSKFSRLVIVEPYFGGSHQQLIETLLDHLGCDQTGADSAQSQACIQHIGHLASNMTKFSIDTNALQPRRCGADENFPLLAAINENESPRKFYRTELYTLPDKKWHWKARVSALYFFQTVKYEHSVEYGTKSGVASHSHSQSGHPPSSNANALQDILFTSSVLNLAELIALRPDLSRFRKVVYFHENQLQYPVQKDQQRDFQYGYNQILTCLVADAVLFNSLFNLNSFIDGISSFLHQIPHQRPDTSSIQQSISCKSHVVPFLINLPSKEIYPDVRSSKPLHIIWPHRWEHDKDPETFFSCLVELLETGYDFLVSVIGQSYQQVPAIFDEARSQLKERIVHWGYMESKHAYYQALASAHVVVSTAKHEFFGVAMLEAAHLGCYPIAPAALAYPEHFPDECLYRTRAQLVKKLRYFCRYPEKTRHFQTDTSRYCWESLKDLYLKHLGLK